MKNQEQPSRRIVRRQVWTLMAYFVCVVLFLTLTRWLFSAVDLENWAGFKKFTDLVNETANVTQRRDDLIVTAYSLVLTLIGVIPVGWVYAITKEEEGYDPSLVQTLIVLAMTVCGVMMMLQDSLARAFGFLGVVGAVRYRNTLKDPKDAVYVFVALGIGMGCGLRVYHVAASLSLVLSLVFLVMWKLRTGEAGLRLLREKSEKDGKGKKDKKDKDKEKKSKEEKLDKVLAKLSDETRLAVKEELRARKSDDEQETPPNPVSRH